MSTRSPSRHELATRLLPLLDLTSLGEDDTPAHIEALCAAARTPHGMPAALCVYPEHVTTTRRQLAEAPIKVATVVNFPDGSSNADRIARETRRAIAAGADEIDLVFPYRDFCRGEMASVERAIVAGREACQAGTILKLILETGALATPSLIREASLLGIAAGVDFLKTSTGKVTVNATLDAAATMLDVIAESEGHCGFKGAGGIRRLADAAAYLDLATTRLGAEWISPTRFRIGASTLFDELVAALAEQP